MITIRLYNKITNKLDFRFKAHYATNHPKKAIEDFANNLTMREETKYAQYLAYAKNGKIIARESSYKGV